MIRSSRGACTRPLKQDRVADLQLLSPAVCTTSVIGSKSSASSWSRPYAHRAVLAEDVRANRSRPP